METLHAKNGNIYIIGCLFRPGSLSFATELEERYFSPDTEELNNQYNLFQTSYCGLPWYIIEVPRTSWTWTAVETLAEEFGLKVINGKPMAIGEEPFNLICSAESAFTLESKEHEGEWAKMLKDEAANIRSRLKMTEPI